MSLESELGENGLHIRGVTRLNADEIENFGLDAGKPMLALVGNIGSSYWSYFSQSPEYRDRLPHPLDRWSLRLAESLGASYAVTPLYPFSGPPYLPFQQWARRAEALEASPLGVMMHPHYGLWHSYRFALQAVDFEAAETPALPASPCLECRDQPCLRRCPVDAFSGGAYALERCADYLRETPAASCHQQGCLARYACPIAPHLSYLHEQGRFHLQAFLKACG